MKTEWDYTALAEAYRARPAYSESVIEGVTKIANLAPSDSICDVGAGLGHLGIPLAKLGFQVTAVEPNQAMRDIGISLSTGLPNITFFEGTGEKTGQKSKQFQLVSFGSSFNVCDQQLALVETARVLSNEGWFACMWNHRDLENPIQKEIEGIIKEEMPEYSYGSRREDQSPIIKQSGLFEEPIYMEARIVHEVPKEQFLEGWRSHATLERQATERFPRIIERIEQFLFSTDEATVSVPYTTRCWMAKKIN